MELEQLRQLDAIARRGTMSAAARALHLSQPALSRSLARLEAELDQPLFDRPGRRLVLNDAGRVALEHARQILRDERAELAAALKQVARSFDLILTTGGVSTGEEDHVKAGIEQAGSLVLWRMAIKPGRPVAMGIIDGTPLIGLPGNPVASFVTFVHVVRPTVLALSGAVPAPLLPLPIRAAFSYKKKSGRREYVRVSLRRAADGALEATKFPREGAGLLSSLVETDGLVELGETVVRVEPGDTVGFLGYADLL